MLEYVDCKSDVVSTRISLFYLLSLTLKGNGVKFLTRSWYLLPNGMHKTKYRPWKSTQKTIKMRKSGIVAKKTSSHGGKDLTRIDCGTLDESWPAPRSSCGAYCHILSLVIHLLLLPRTLCAVLRTTMTPCWVSLGLFCYPL